MTLLPLICSGTVFCDSEGTCRLRLTTSSVASSTTHFPTLSILTVRSPLHGVNMAMGLECCSNIGLSL